MNRLPWVFASLALASLVSIESLASVTTARWEEWRFRIDQRHCELTRSYNAGNSPVLAEQGFLGGTHFGTMMFHILAKTSFRDADSFRLGETIFGVKIWSQLKIEPSAQLASLAIGPYSTVAAEFAERQGSEEIRQAFSGFWFYGTEADELLYRMEQGEPVRVVAKNALGQTVIETEYASRERDRLPAWAAAFRACAVANRE